MTDEHSWAVNIAIDKYYSLITGGRTPEQAANILRQERVPEDTVQFVVTMAIKRFVEVDTAGGTLVPGLREPHRLWYPGPRSDDRFWPALKAYLEAKGWEAGEVNSLDQSSNLLLASLEAPGTQSFQTKGLVVGYVQSGKTASYTALIAKAADAGYRHFVVIAGTTEKLRRQTQERLSTELAELRLDIWLRLTTGESDMAVLQENANAMLSSAKHRTLAVVKKNSRVLKKLQHWMASAGQPVLENCPILLIDDEADEASINTSRSPNRKTAVNQQLVNLSSFPKTAYVAYTATPFANLLIDPESANLYPKDFIIPLPKPKAYFGPERIFGREFLPEAEGDEEIDGLDMIRRIPETELKSVKVPRLAEKESFQPTVSESLRKAVRWFLLTQAARIARGHDASHSTMLVHTSQYTAAHRNMKRVLEAEIADLRTKVEAGNTEVLRELEGQWTEEAVSVPPSLFGAPALDWTDLRPLLAKAVGRMRAVLENATQSELDYASSEPTAFVVTGGNILSRGLTLTGLTTSYFIRSAGSYDTLLQMGRWFGYHKGYVDLLRIWMTDDLKQNFRDLALVEEEIRNDMTRYSGSITPLKFAVKIRTHPGLNVTAPLKQQAAVTVQTSYYGSRLQTILFNHKDANWLGRNIDAVTWLLESVERVQPVPKDDGRALLYEGIPYHVVHDFFQRYQLHPRNRRFTNELLSKFLKLAGERNELVRWDIGLVQPSSPDTKTADLNGRKVKTVKRSRFIERSDSQVADIVALMSDGDLGIGLPADKRSGKAETLLKNRTNLPEKRGLLLVYPIDKDSEPSERHRKGRESLDASDTVIGVALVFPDLEGGTVVEKVQAPIQESVEEELEELDVEDQALEVV